MPSRRALLTGAVASTALLAGCAGLTGEASSDDGGVRSCETSAEARGQSSDLVQQAGVTADETALFRVVLDRDAAAFDAFDRLYVLDTTGRPRFVLPRDDPEGSEPARRVYEQALGPFPQSGVFRVEARDSDGNVLDYLLVESSCHVTTPARG